jgi:hypothetical protein
MAFTNVAKNSASGIGTAKNNYNDDLLMESGSYLLLESGDRFLVISGANTPSNTDKNNASFTNFNKS